MIHNDPIGAIQRSRKRSMRLIMEMFADMAALVANQHSLVWITRYMIACFNYRIQDIIIGSHPYPDHIVPCLGSAYSQQDRIHNTPTTEIIDQHFSENPELRSSIVSCICESWKTIKVGCIWLNASYDNGLNGSSCPVMALKRLQYMIELICMLLQAQAISYGRKSFMLLTMGQQGLYVASCVSQRLRCRNIRCVIVQSGQPAQLSRITYNEALIGKHAKYTCMTQSAKAQLVRIAGLYKSVQGTPASAVSCAMSKSVKAIIESAMDDILARANTLGSEFDNLETLEKDVVAVDGTVQVQHMFRLFQGIKRICALQQTLIVDLTECILTNAYVRAIIQDREITSLDASVKPSNTVPANPVVSSTPDNKQ